MLNIKVMSLVNYVGIIFILVLIFAIIAMKYEFRRLIRKIDGFDRPRLNRDINYTVLGMCLCSFLIGAVFVLLILG